MAFDLSSDNATRGLLSYHLEIQGEINTRFEVNDYILPLKRAIGCFPISFFILGR
jgi:hypothetical protein